MGITNRKRYGDLRNGISGLFSRITGDIEEARQQHTAKPITEKVARLQKRYAAAISDIATQDQANDKVIDRLVSEWSGAQGLVLMPELVDDTNPDIDRDVSDMLIGAEATLEGLVDGYLTPELKEMEFTTLKDLYGFDDAQCDMFARLQTAEEVLEAYQDTLTL